MSKRLYTAARLLVHWGTGGLLACVAWRVGAQFASVVLLFAVAFVIGQLIAVFVNPYKK